MVLGLLKTYDKSDYFDFAEKFKKIIVKYYLKAMQNEIDDLAGEVFAQDMCDEGYRSRVDQQNGEVIWY